MLESLYAAQTGLSAFAKGLNTISNNVANLNTPGFKRLQAGFQDLLYQQSYLGDANQPFVQGSGVEVGGTFVVAEQGELRQSGNSLDSAIDGNGFFVLTDGNEQKFTRSGQFQLDDDGFMIHQSSNLKVGFLQGNSVVSYQLDSDRTNPFKLTTRIQVDGNLSKNDSDNAHTISDINTIDSTGTPRLLRILFSNASSTSWTFDIQDATATSLSKGTIAFQGDGSVVQANETHEFKYTPTGAPEQTITIEWGKAGQFNGLTNFSSGTDSTAKVKSVDGYGVGALTKLEFDESGVLNLTYSNGQTQKRGALALAYFNDADALFQQGGNVYASRSDDVPMLGTANTSIFGKIKGGNIEASNVDLTQQFSDLIVTQRGYQASSQVLATINEMLQQALELRSRR